MPIVNKQAKFLTSQYIGTRKSAYTKGYALIWVLTEGTEYTSTFAVVKANDAIVKIQEDTGVQLHGILGIPFLMENKWKIDFEKMIVTCH